MKTVDLIAAGIISIGLVTAFGLHSSQLSGLVKQTGSSGNQILGTAEEG